MENELLAPDAFEELAREHQAVLLQLDALEGAFVEFGKKEAGENWENLRTVEDVLTHLEEDLGIHLRKEEEILFPAISQLSSRLEEGPVKAMLWEHEVLRREVDRLKKALEVLGVESDRVSFEEMRHAGYELIELLRLHIQKEDHCLFPMGRNFLDQDRLQTLGKRMRFIESGSEHHLG